MNARSLPSGFSQETPPVMQTKVVSIDCGDMQVEVTSYSDGFISFWNPIEGVAFDIHPKSLSSLNAIVESAKAGIADGPSKGAAGRAMNSSVATKPPGKNIPADGTAQVLRQNIKSVGPNLWKVNIASTNGKKKATYFYESRSKARQAEFAHKVGKFGRVI